MFYVFSRLVVKLYHFSVTSSSSMLPLPLHPPGGRQPQAQAPPAGIGGSSPCDANGPPTSFVEDHFQHSDAQNGLSRAMGLTFNLSERWSVAANWELGTLIDHQTHAETDRKAGGANVRVDGGGIWTGFCWGLTGVQASSHAVREG